MAELIPLPFGFYPSIFYPSVLYPSVFCPPAFFLSHLLISMKNKKIASAVLRLAGAIIRFFAFKKVVSMTDLPDLDSI